jgi:hypothetical protein
MTTKKTKTSRKRKSSRKYPRKHKVVKRKQRRTRRIRGGEVNPGGLIAVNAKYQPSVTPPQGSEFSNDPEPFEEVSDKKKLLSRLDRIFIKDHILTDEKIFIKYKLIFSSYEDAVINEALDHYKNLYDSIDDVDDLNKDLITGRITLLESILNSRKTESAPPTSAPPTPTPPISFFSSMTSFFKKPPKK